MIVEIRMTGSGLIADLNHRPHQNNLPFRMRARQLVQQLEIDAFVDDAIVAEARMRKHGLIARFLYSLDPEILRLHRARKTADIRVPRPFCPVETWAAGKYKVGHA